MSIYRSSLHLSPSLSSLPPSSTEVLLSHIVFNLYSGENFRDWEVIASLFGRELWKSFNLRHVKGYPVLFRA